MNTNSNQSSDKLIVGAVLWVLFGLIATTVLANQSSYAPVITARVIHLINITTSLYIVFYFVTSRLFFSILFTIFSLFFVDKFFEFRIPYLISLNILFFIVGLLISRFFRNISGHFLSFIVIVSGVVMLLQLLGVGEWTQLLTTHGILADGTSLPKTPHPTLFIAAADLQANHLQGRPAGLLHSNQFASLVILFALALSMTARGRRHLLVDLLLCATAVLTLAKVVFLGFGALVVILFIWGDADQKGVAIRFILLFLISLAIYWICFPGIINIYLLHIETFWVSVFSRVVNIGYTAFNMDKDTLFFVLKYSEKLFGLIKDRYIGDEVMRDIIETQTKSPGSIFAALFQYYYIFIIFIVFFVFFNIVKPNITSYILSIFRDYFDIENVAVIAVLVCIGLTANFLSSQIFWLMIGFGFKIEISRNR